MNKKALYFILILIIFAGALTLQTESLSQETSSDTDGTVIVCKTATPSRVCDAQENDRIATTLDEAYELLQPLGGGTVFINPGIYETTLALDGDWVLKGVDFPASVTLVPRELGPASTAQVAPNRLPAMITANTDSTIHLENLTFYHHVSLINAPPDSSFAIGLRVSGDRDSGANVTLKNVQFYNFEVSPFWVDPFAQIDLEATRTSCAPQVFFSIGVVVIGNLNSRNSLYENCYIQTTISAGTSFVGNRHFDGDRFTNTLLALLGNSTVRNSQFYNSYNDVPADIDTFYQLRIAHNVILENNTFINTQNFDFAADFSFRSLLVYASQLTLNNNQFIGFDLAINFEGRSVEGNHQLTNNTFRDNRVAIEFAERTDKSQHLNFTNNQFVNSDCSISILSDLEFIEIAGSSNSFENIEQITCPDEISLPDDFIAE